MLKIVYDWWNGLKRIVFTNRVRGACVSCGEGLVVNGRSYINGRTYLGHHVNMNGMRICGDGEVHIGNYFHSGVECLILTQNHNYDKGETIPYDSNDIYKPVNIGDCVWLGSRVTILPGVTIGEGAIIQAGSVVTSNIPYCGIAGGSPAVVFKYRDIEHYEELKKEGKFQ